MPSRNDRSWPRAAAGGILLFTVALVLALVVGPRPAPASVSSLEVAVATGSDDAEELLSGWFGSTSSDLELVDENSPQTVGIRFAALDIPVGATIESAYLRFTVDEAGSGDTQLTIAAEDTGNAPTFSSTARVSTRSITGISVSWSPHPWTVIGSTGADQTSPNLAEIVQHVVDRTDWTPGNAIAFIFTGTGTRTADSFEGGHPPVLSVSWNTGSETTTTPPTTTVTTSPTTTTAPTTSTTSTTQPSTTTTTTLPGALPSTFETPVSTSGDDVEQRPNGTLYANSSDLELVEDAGVQHVGIRFQGLPVPHGATILTAWIQFTVDEVSTAPTQVEVRAHDAADSQSFNGNNDVTGRPTTVSVIQWDVEPWPTVGEATEAQRTPPLTAIVQAVVDRTDWVNGNAISFLISGTGRRTAESFDGKTSAAPKLHVEWTTGPPTTTTTTTTVPPTTTTSPTTTTTSTSTTTTSVPPTTTSTTPPTTTTTSTTTTTIPVPVNAPPTVTADATASTAGGTTSLQATITDDGLPDPPGSTTVLWEQIAGPATASIANPRAVTTSAVLPIAGQYTFRVTVTDGALYAANETDVTASAVGTTTTHLAVIGDFGGSAERMNGLADMIDAWGPSAIVTVGDNVYSSAGFDRLVGRYFHEYIGDYSGAYGAGAATNRFFPTLGNHDYTDGGLNNYLSFFDLPGPGVSSSNSSGNERYYDVRLGNVHVFVVNSNLQEPDGIGANSVQGQWLHDALAASDAEWKIVSFHHPAYSSVPGKTTTYMRWPFADWDVDLVLSGHAHVYERLQVDGLDYVVAGLGLNNTPLSTGLIPQSQAFWSQDKPGALFITACAGALELEFHPVGAGVVDQHTIGTGHCP